MYKILYYMMCVGFGGLGILSPGWKGKTIGICLLIVNALIFYKK